MIRIFCDRCGANITNSGAFGRIVARIFETADLNSPSKPVLGENDDNIHFCSKCMEDIKNFINKPVPETDIPAKPNQDSANTSKPSRRKRIDYGKLIALQKAGWTYQQIADEMGMTPGSVGTALTHYRKSQIEEL